MAFLDSCCHGMAIRRLAGPGGSSGETAAAAAPASSGYRAAAWPLVALVPRLAATIQALSDDPEAATAFPTGHITWLDKLAGVCLFVHGSLVLLAALEGRPASQQQLTTWAAAAPAGLRLQPTLLQLGASFWRSGIQPMVAGTTPDHAAKLSAVLLHRLWLRIPAGDAQPSAACSLTAAQLWELHSAAARLCHMLIGRGRPCLACWQSTDLSPLACWENVLAGLDSVFGAAQLAMLSRLDVLGGPDAGGPAE